jgi:hypothetical protein
MIDAISSWRRFDLAAPPRHSTSTRRVAQCEHRQAACDQHRGEAHEHLLGRRLSIGRDELQPFATRTDVLEDHAHESGRVQGHLDDTVLKVPEETDHGAPRRMGIRPEPSRTWPAVDDCKHVTNRQSSLVHLRAGALKEQGGALAEPADVRGRPTQGCGCLAGRPILKAALALGPAHTTKSGRAPAIRHHWRALFPPEVHR